MPGSMRTRRSLGSMACRSYAQIGWALGVWLALLGSILLLMRSRWAVWSFGLSLVGAVLSLGYQMLLAPPMPGAHEQPDDEGDAVRYPGHRVALFLYARGRRRRRACFGSVSAGQPRRPPNRVRLLLSEPALAGAGLAFAGVAERARRDAVVVGDAEVVLLEPADLVAKPRGFLELEVGGGLAHPLLEVGEIGLEVVTDEVRPLLVAGVDDHPVAGPRCGEMSWMLRLMLSGVMPCSALYSSCFSRRRPVSASARSIEPVMVSA